MDIFDYGEPFTTVGKMTLYKLPEVKVVTWAATQPVEELLDMLTEVKVVTCRSQSIVLVYACNLSVWNIYHEVENKLKRHFKAVMTAGSVELGVVTYIDKKDHKQFPENMDIMHITPKRCRFKLRGSGSMPKTMTTVQGVMKNTVTNIFIKVSPGSYSFEQMVDITNKLPMENLITIRGRALMKPTIQQTEFEKMFLKIFVDLKVLKELKNTSSSVLFSAYEPPDSLGIVPMDKIINLYQKGTRRREVQGTEEEHSTNNISSDICE